MNQFRNLYGLPADARYVIVEDLSAGDVIQWMETISLPVLGVITSIRTKGRFFIIDARHADRARPGSLARKRFSLVEGTTVLVRTNVKVEPCKPFEQLVQPAFYVRRNRTN